MHSRRLSRTRNSKARLLVFLILLGGLSLGVLFFGRYLPLAYQVVFNKKIELKKNQQGRITILLLGIGGGTHEGPNLSDSMIFVSIDPVTQKATLVSIPRDLWIPDINNKINAAYAFGEEKQQGGGLVLAKAIVQKVVGQQIDYGVRIDFDGFVKAVDLIGGLDITVENTFDDYEYPIEGKENDPCGHKTEELTALATASSQLETFPCRYKHLHFDTGIQHMDGQTALQYVRSRHALGPEGSDFARSRRQANVISAFKTKVFSLQTLLNPGKVLSLYGTLKDSIDTDITQNELDDFLRLAQAMKGAKITSTVIDYGDLSNDRAGLLINPPITQEYNNTWVLIPRTGNGDFSEVHTYVECVLTRTVCVVPKSPTMTLPPLPTQTVKPTK